MSCEQEKKDLKYVLRTFIKRYGNIVIERHGVRIEDILVTLLGLLNLNIESDEELND